MLSRLSERRYHKTPVTNDLALQGLGKDRMGAIFLQVMRLCRPTVNCRIIVMGGVGCLVEP